jgi:Opioid growth factor receptor (OGFr) conserved region
MRGDLLGFYRGTDVDNRGRRLDEILAWDDERLEAVHDFIQWLFPLGEPSQFNLAAPLLTPADIREFRTDPMLRDNLLRSAARMFGFYGFELSDAGGRFAVGPGAQFDQRRHVVYGGFNHNHLRITRILKSLSLLGLGDVARGFLIAMRANDAAKSVPRESLTYWAEACRPCD